MEADPAPGSREFAPGGVLVRQREVLPGVKPVALDDQAHRRLMRADQRASKLTAQLERDIDAALELASCAFFHIGHRASAFRAEPEIRSSPKPSQRASGVEDR